MIEGCALPVPDSCPGPQGVSAADVDIEETAMGIPQITDRMRSAPVQALRTLFAGIGRILLAADRPPEQRARAARQAGADVEDSRRASSGQRPAGPVSAADSRWRSLDKTGNVRLLSPEDMDDDLGGRAQPGRPGPAEPESAPDPAEHEASAPEPAEHDSPVALPMASYDTLSLASIRARLRNLDADQLRVLVGYEQSHAERPEVLGMLERRIAKLETGG
jgi:hypothetical protein